VPELTPEPKAAEPVVPEGIRRARAAFLRDFAALMADRATRGKFVCYHNDALAAVAKDYRAAVRAAVAKNIPEDASLIFRVAPGEDDAVRAIIEEAEIS
jgi:hypothetical protein